MGYIVSSTGEKLEQTKNYIEIKSKEFKQIKSMWSGFMGAANAGMNNLANKLNQLLNAGTANQYPQDADYKSPFKPVEIDTGLSVQLEPNEVLQVYIPTENAGKGLMLACGNNIVESGPIKIYVYNMFPSETQVKIDEVIAFATFMRVNNPTNQGLKYYNGWNVKFDEQPNNAEQHTNEVIKQEVPQGINLVKNEDNIAKENTNIDAVSASILKENTDTEKEEVCQETIQRINLVKDENTQTNTGVNLYK